MTITNDRQGVPFIESCTSRIALRDKRSLRKGEFLALDKKIKLKPTGDHNPFETCYTDYTFVLPSAARGFLRLNETEKKFEDEPR